MRPGAGPLLAAAWALAGLLAALPAPAAAAPADGDPGQPAAGIAVNTAGDVPAAARGTGFEVTPAVRGQLQQLQVEWLRWTGAADREHSESAVGEMLATAGQMGMTRLPDLSLGALAWAMESARHHDFARAEWALAAAERLDPGRPEPAFAVAAVAWQSRSWLRAATALGSAYSRLLLLPLPRFLWLQDLLMWGGCLLLVTGGLFVAALLATRGAGLFHDCVRLFPARLPRALAILLAAAVLLWPLALPGGLLWAPLLWSLLLWGYGSGSERTVLIALWLLLGAAPVLIAAQERAVAVRLSPPVKALDSLRERRLYGGLFTDLGTLRTSLPDSTAVTHLVADVHRVFNQWDLARGFYREVLVAEPQNASALLDLGVYAYNRGDTNSAIQFFQQASAADPHNAAAAQFNLSQAYNEAYLFDEAHRALAQAKSIDAEAVDRWLANVDQEKVVVAAGGLALIPQIEASLAGVALRPDLARHGSSLMAALGLILVAVALHLARRPFGYTESNLQWRLGGRALDRWRRALVPGLSAVEAGEGARAYLALLTPAGLLMLPLFERMGYRIPWGYDAGSTLPWIVSISGLMIYLVVRLRWELHNAV